MEEQSNNIRMAEGAQLLDAESVNNIRETMTHVIDKYAEFVHMLNENQLKHMLRTGLKNNVFAQEVFRMCAANPNLMSGYFGMRKFEADYMGFDNWKMLYNDASRIEHEMKIRLLVAGEKLYRDSLAVYEYMKEAARRGDAACELASNELKSRFEFQGHKKKDSSDEPLNN